MRLLINNIVLLLLFLSGTALKADAWDEYWDLITKYKNIKSIKGTIITNYYLENANKISKIETGEFIINQNKKWLNYGNIILLNNDKFQITIDKVNKYVMLNKANTKEEVDKIISGIKPITKDSLINLRKIVQMNQSTNANGDKLFEMIFPKDYAYKKIDLQFTSHGIFSKMIYEFNRNKDKAYPYKVEIIYKRLILNSTIVPEEFSEKKILTIKGNDVKLLDNYSAYKLLDYRKLQMNSKK